MPDIDAVTLKTAELAALLDLTPRRVRQLAEEGVLTRGAGRKFLLVPSVKAYLAQVRTNPDEAEWRARRERADALLREHRLAALHAERTDPMGLWPRWLAVSDAHIRRVFDLQNRLPPILAPLGDPFAIQDVLRDALEAELHLYADALEDATPTPYREGFRAARAVELAELATIAAASTERREKLDAARARDRKV